jgi:alanyl-tRNA synthetase
MMNSNEIRKTFLDFFASKKHQIVPSAPMVVKNDPTLMFTNAGMNQFKDIFLGNTPAKYLRVADTQKCLRVSGKHNDLEEVGHDTYHHTMFEMLGNWSFGDYFKKEAIQWAWELLHDTYGIDKGRMYVTVFGGDTGDNLPADKEALDLWKAIVPEDRIIFGSKKDNFWEMGDTGPCGPCSEIHVDIRDDEERRLIDGKTLVNSDHPLVIEIWNLVFIEFNRQSNGSLVQLPARHVDTGMGFERLCMVLQSKKSNYDTDVFQPLISEIAKISGIAYSSDPKASIAMRVIADHFRAIAFAIADGQLPSNNKAGYVIRRILRRAVRYGYTFLNLREPFIHKLLPVIVDQMGGIFTELISQQSLIGKVIAEEEQSFLRTLSLGIQKFNQYITSNQESKKIEGNFAFELFDTYGFPIDLTRLMAKEEGWVVDMDGFNKGLEAQKSRSRQDAVVATGDWVEVNDDIETSFVGYDSLEADVKIIRYRKLNVKGKDLFQLVFDITPFYAESGGQAGDSGIIICDDEKIKILDCRKENNLIVHIAETLPVEPEKLFKASVNKEKRQLTENNHTATHLLHFALRKIVGTHVEQKGSFVGPDYLRFDFSHFQKLSANELKQVETLVNKMIRENLPLHEEREATMEEAQKLGAMALFGEKYGDSVRLVCFGDSIELCGGTHVSRTGQIGILKISSESAIAAGVRRVEAITADTAEAFLMEQAALVDELKQMTKSPVEPLKAVQSLMDQNAELRRQIDNLNASRVAGLKDELIRNARVVSGIYVIITETDLDQNAIKDLAFSIKNGVDKLFLVIGSAKDGKASLTVMLSENVAEERKLNASQIVRELAVEIQGGGGGQAFYATAGGKKPEGIAVALQKAEIIIS